jgi:hypothetical protein
MHIKRNAVVISLLLAAMLVGSIPGQVVASSHREAPAITFDPAADSTDFYMFRSPDAQDTVTFVANYVPLEEPAGGPTFYRFDDNVNYRIYVDNNADGVEDITYQFKFKTNIKNREFPLFNSGAINSIDDATYNLSQSYTVTKLEKGKAPTVIGHNLVMPPSNIGDKSIPNYETLFQQGINNLGDGVKVFAGQTDDPFFIDLAGSFDLLNTERLSNPSDTIKGFNVHAIVLQVPIRHLTKSKTQPNRPTDPDAVIGGWTAAFRDKVTVIRQIVPVPQPSARPTVPNIPTRCRINPEAFGCPLISDPNVSIPEDVFNQPESTIVDTENRQMVQVSRLANPLFNELLVPMSRRDEWNARAPRGDGNIFGVYARNSALAGLIRSVFNLPVPTTSREDIYSIFFTGLADVNKPSGRVVPSEEMRLNVGVPVTVHPERLGVLAGDLQGYPNGRRLTDDVVDISLQAVAGATANVAIPASFGDGINANEKAFSSTFPYVAMPHSGTESLPHSQSQSSGQNNNTIALVTNIIKDNIGGLYALAKGIFAALS